jgi:hypothetical protein
MQAHNKTPRRFGCLLCTHCYLSGGEYGYSEVTPGGPGTFECEKGHFDLEPHNMDTETIVNTLNTHIDCPDYKERPQ